MEIFPKAHNFWKKTVINHCLTVVKYFETTINTKFKPLLNDTHGERVMFHLIQYQNGWLAASDPFDMFTQSIKFYTLQYQYRCLKNVIH